MTAVTAACAAMNLTPDRVPGDQQQGDEYLTVATVVRRT
jgi:hypothetical protein